MLLTYFQQLHKFSFLFPQAKLTTYSFVYSTVLFSSEVAQYVFMYLCIVWTDEIRGLAITLLRVIQVHALSCCSTVFEICIMVYPILISMKKYIKKVNIVLASEQLVIVLVDQQYGQHLDL